MSMLEIRQFLERLGNLVRSQARRSSDGEDLPPVHLNTLYYLSICNRYSDTLLAVSNYLNQTKGTTSQTLKLLEKKGFITKQPDPKDGRVSHLKLTALGREKVVQCWPSPVLKAVEKKIPISQQDALRDLLKNLLHTCQQANEQKSFAVCHSCRHNEKRAEDYFCRLTQEPLSPKDITLICQEHEYSNTS